MSDDRSMDGTPVSREEFAGRVQLSDHGAFIPMAAGNAGYGHQLPGRTHRFDFSETTIQFEDGNPIPVRDFRAEYQQDPDEGNLNQYGQQFLQRNISSGRPPLFRIELKASVDLPTSDRDFIVDEMPWAITYDDGVARFDHSLSGLGLKICDLTSVRVAKEVLWGWSPRVWDSIKNGSSWEDVALAAMVAVQIEPDSAFTSQILSLRNRHVRRFGGSPLSCMLLRAARTSRWTSRLCPVWSRSQISLFHIRIVTVSRSKKCSVEHFLHSLEVRHE